MNSTVAGALRFVVTLVLLYILSYAFDFMNAPSTPMFMLGLLIFIIEGTFVAWWLRRWVIKLDNELNKQIDAQVEAHMKTSRIEFQEKPDSISKDIKQTINSRQGE